MTVAKVIEIIGKSDKSWQDAVENAVKETAKTVRRIRRVYVKRVMGRVKENKIVEYSVAVRIIFDVER
ncbi:dodecin domain-containing protein [Candidatus Bathyarchaeota archaeon]|nr:MAG: dodecin domain-containing protein [Candidatus Bathyarchaeota archaeon]